MCLASEQQEISYEEANKNYRYFKSRTLKANADESDFEQNMKFREFFLGIKKRYDMQYRAQKFRTKQKEEIAQLKQAVQENTTSVIGKRDRPCEDDLQEQFEQMRLKIQKLEEQIDSKDKKYEELLQSSKATSQQNTNIDEEMSDNYSVKNQSEQ